MPVPSSPAANGSQLDLPGAELRFFPQWLSLPQADALLRAIRATVEWETHRIRMFGRHVDSPRQSSWIGDEGADYTYSGTRFAPRPWPEPLVALRQQLDHDLEHRFNSVLANRYRDGRDYMGWHSDDEAALGIRPIIASISLGATRRFVLKHRKESSRPLQLELPHGSLLVMGGDTQVNYRHALPRTARPVGERINLTFRKILA